MTPVLTTAERVTRLARDLHAELGTALSLEAYEAALAFELEQRGIAVERQRPVQLLHEGERMDFGYIADLLVEQRVVVRIGALHRLEPGTEAWTLERLDLPQPCVGLFLDFRRPELELLQLPEPGE
jgi:GxxExxY protein